MSAEIRLWWKDRRACETFEAGVSLHSHTLHSRECLSFMPHYIDALPLVRWLIRREVRRHGLDDIPYAEFSNAWWTPPLSAQAAWRVEASQIQDGLQLRAMVSLTDHDSIEAPLRLQAVGVPISLEWSLPYLGAAFHVGVHNLPASAAAELASAMSRYTAGQAGVALDDLFEELSRHRETLIVLNHPLWDEGGVGIELHRFALGRLLGRHGHAIHALELNSDRPWKENQGALDIARLNGLPVVSGGDRHGCEPNPVINLTNAEDFAEFAAEVRSGRSVIAILPRFRESRKVRLFEAAFDILRDHPDHGMGWVRWSDRVFYRRKNGTVASVAELWGRGQPGAVAGAVNLMALLGRQQVRPALRWALAEREAAL